MAVSIPTDPFLYLHPSANLIVIQRQDQCNTEPHVSTNIDSSDPGPLYIRGPTTLEMANSIGRDCSLLDKYELRQWLSIVR